MLAMGYVTDRGAEERRVPVLEDLPDPGGKSVLVRATFNRPLAADPAQPLAELRARGLGATIEWLHKAGAQVTLCGDTGEVDGARRRLTQLRHALRGAFSSPEVAEAVSFRSASEGVPAVGRLLAGHDLFVNDSLQDSFLPLPSLMVPPTRVPSAAGRTLEHDLAVFDKLLADPPRPFVVILGGERSFDRLHGLEGLVLRADTVLLGGALALPMLQALGSQPADGATASFLWSCRHIIGLSQRVRHRLNLPLDLVWRAPDGSSEVTAASSRGSGEVADVGPLTRIRFAEEVQGAGSILWAGALGIVEEQVFASGTHAVAASLPSDGAVVIGGDALAASLAAAGLLSESADMLSATDAAVELLKNGDLPALSALRGH